MKQMLLAATILAAATAPGWATTSLQITDSAATGSDPVLLNEATTFNVDIVGNPSIASPLTLYFIEPTGVKSPVVTQALFNGVTPDTFTIGAAQAWNASAVNSFYAFEGCSSCSASINLANIDAVETQFGLGSPTAFTVIPVTITQAFAKGDFEAVFGSFANGTIVAPFGTNAEGQVFNTSWTNAGFVDGPVDGVPEPATWAMMGVGFILLGSVGWRRRTARLAA